MQYRIELLGGLRVRSAAGVVERFSTRKTASLLAFLAAPAGRKHPREVLIEQFWPDGALPAGRQNLSQSLSSLRRRLEPPGVEPGSVVGSDRANVWLQSRTVTTDVELFEAAVNRALGESDVEARRQDLETALDLYGGPLLPGFYDDWIPAEQQRLTDRWVLACRQLIADGQCQGRPDEALNVCRRAIGSEPLREELHQDLLRLLRQTGQPEEAGRHLKRLTELFERELGCAPSDTTRAIVEERLSPPRRWRIELESSSAVHSPAVASESQHASSARETRNGPATPLPGGGRRLPVPTSPLIGRDGDLQELIARLAPAAGETRGRLCTLTGPAGIGKTRLALEFAHHTAAAYGDRVWFVPLTDLTEPRLLEEAIQDELALTSGERRTAAEMIEGLAEQPVLLVLDNFEQLVDTASERLKRFLDRFPNLTLLVTSQRVIGLTGEMEFPVKPLASPAEGLTPNALERCPSVALFLSRARQVRPDISLTLTNAADVAQICIRLEGIPLALELAAARVGILTPSQILQQVEEPLDFLATRHRDVPVRHRTLRRALEWSLRSLCPLLQRFLARLAACSDPWSLDLVRRIAPEGADVLDGLAALREYSLIMPDEREGEMRYRMLDLIRTFALDQADASDLEQARSIQAGWFADRIRAVAGDANAPTGALDDMAQQRAGLRAAVAWNLEKDPDSGLELSFLLAQFWIRRGSLLEAMELVLSALGSSDPAGLTRRHASLHALAGYLALRLGRAEAADYYERALDLWNRLGDTSAAARSYVARGNVAHFNGDYALARKYYEQGIAFYEKSGDETSLACALNDLALIASEEGDQLTAQRLLERSREAWGSSATRQGLEHACLNLAVVFSRQAMMEDARRLCWESIDLSRGDGSLLGIVRGIELLAAIAQKEHDPGLALRLLGAADAARESLGAPMYQLERAERDALLRDLRGCVGSPSAAQEWFEGRSLTWTEALDLASKSRATSFAPRFAGQPPLALCG